MARGEQLGRQWKMLQILTGARGGKTVSELAAEVGCHPRTAYRDLEALQIAGFPLYTDRREGKNRWALLDTARRQSPLPLSLTELMALYLSRSLLQAMRDTVYSEALETLFEKIRATLPEKTLQYIDRVSETLQVGSRRYRSDEAGRAALDTVQESILQRQTLEIRYYAMSRGTETRRKVEPYKIWFFDGAYYLLGYCRLRRSLRVFSLDRIRSVETTPERFEMPEDIDAERLMKKSFGVFLGTPVKVRVRFSREAAGYIRERIWHETQVLTALSDGGVDFEATVAGLEEITFWVLSWGRNAEVLAPARLRDALAREAKALCLRYDRPPGAEEKAGKEQDVELGNENLEFSVPKPER